jgi:type VI secretion system protein ImpB
MANLQGNKAAVRRATPRGRAVRARIDTIAKHRRQTLRQTPLTERQVEHQRSARQRIDNFVLAPERTDREIVMSASVHDKLNRVRKPRVHITYDVETEGAQIARELPFVVGVMGDFSGDPTTPLRPMSERKFIQIDRDNFNDVLARMTPGVKLKVDNKLADDGSQMSVDLKFNSMDDFEPAKIVDQVPALKALMETRNKLRDLMSKVDRSEDLENLLEQVLKNETDLKSLSGQLGLGKQEG